MKNKIISALICVSFSSSIFANTSLVTEARDRLSAIYPSAKVGSGPKYIAFNIGLTQYMLDLHLNKKQLSEPARKFFGCMNEGWENGGYYRPKIKSCFLGLSTNVTKKECNIALVGTFADEDPQEREFKDLCKYK